MGATRDVPSRVLYGALIGLVCASVAYAFAPTPLPALPPAPVAKSSVSWERTHRVADGDSIRVPVRWSPSCDALGCPDAYRVTWTLATPQAVSSADNGVVRIPNEDLVSLAKVVREVTVEATADTVVIEAPPFNVVATVCVSVVAMRRGLASTATSGCRTVERFDAPPPPVDSIRWDSVTVETDTLAVYPLLDMNTFAPENSAYQYKAEWVGDTVVRLLDSSRVAYDESNGQRIALMTVGWFTVLCPTVQGTDGTYWVIVPRLAGDAAWSPSRLATYQRRCSSAERVVASGRPARFFYDYVSYTIQSGGGASLSTPPSLALATAVAEAVAN